MTNTINLVLGIHNHQPVGNFDGVFEHAYVHSYKIFLDVLERHPGVKLTLHNTGILLDWIKEHHPEWFEQVKFMVDRGQIELMTGGFYEPILSVIPDRDKLGQIQKQTAFTQKHFGQTPRGMWLAERVWEPGLAKPLHEAGVEYVALDTSHFQAAGMGEDDLFGYFVTEEQGSPLKIFPISEQLRYTIPFQQVHKTIDYLRSKATSDGKRIAVMADDGEKFGVWPMTFNSVYEQGWLENFFSALEANADWIKCRTFSEVAEALEPIGRIYLPTASYMEMMEWALPASVQTRFEDLKHEIESRGEVKRYEGLLKGGFWRNFLSKYVESNTMQKMMLWTSDLIEANKKSFKPAQLKKAQDEVWQSQCNCPYWHGVFGGLYLPHLRFAIYRHMTRALNQLAEALHETKSWQDVTEHDIQKQGFNDLIVDTNDLVAVLTPRYGGALRTLLLRQEEFNLLDTLARRPEAYHRTVREGNRSMADDGSASIHDIVHFKEEGLADRLDYDWHHRGAFQDHVISAENTVTAMARSRQNELGDFVLERYETSVKKLKSGVQVTLRREGLCAGAGLTIEKTLTFPAKSRGIQADYRMVNRSENTLRFRFGVEFGASLLAGNAPDRYYRVEDHDLTETHLASQGALDEVSAFEVHDEWLKLNLRWTVDKPCHFWRFPIETVSNSESGFERVYQSSVLFPNWVLDLAPGEEWNVNLLWEMKRK